MFTLRPMQADDPSFSCPVYAGRRIGQFDVFLVPVGRDDAGFRYEAVFNLLLQQP